MAVKRPSWRMVSGGFDGATSGGGRPFKEVPKGVMNGVNRTFTLTYTPWLGFVQIFINGNAQNPFVPRYAISGNIITYAVAPKADDEHYCWYFRGPAGSAALSGARGFGSVGINASDAADFGNNPIYNILGSMAYGCWVKLSSSAQGFLVFRGYEKHPADGTGATNECFRLAPSASGSKWDLLYFHEWSGSTNMTLTFSTQLESDVWYYVGFSRDTTAKTVTMWVGDGATLTLIATLGYTTNPDGGSDPSCHLVIGNAVKDSFFGDTQLNGAMAQNYIWTRAITAAEHTLAMAGSPPSSDLILNIPLGTAPETDSTGNGGTPSITGTLIVEGH